MPLDANIDNTILVHLFLHFHSSLLQVFVLEMVEEASGAISTSISLVASQCRKLKKTDMLEYIVLLRTGRSPSQTFDVVYVNRRGSPISVFTESLPLIAKLQTWHSNSQSKESEEEDDGKYSVQLNEDRPLLPALPNLRQRRPSPSSDGLPSSSSSSSSSSSVGLPSSYSGGLLSSLSGSGLPASSSSSSSPGGLLSSGLPSGGLPSSSGGLSYGGLSHGGLSYGGLPSSAPDLAPTDVPLVSIHRHAPTVSTNGLANFCCDATSCIFGRRKTLAHIDVMYGGLISAAARLFERSQIQTVMAYTRNRKGGTCSSSTFLTSHRSPPIF